jgi:hypothetical protein
LGKGGGGDQGGGPSRGYYHPHLQHPGGGRRGVSFEDSADYDFADDDRNLYGEGQYPPRRAFNDAEYKARRNSIFLPDGVPPTTNDTRQSMPPPETVWHEQQHAGLPPTMNLPGPQGQQGQQVLTLGPPGVNQMNMQGHQGHQGQLHTTGPPGGGQIPMPGVATPQAMVAPQGGAQTAVTTHHPHNNGGGVPNAQIGRGAQGTTSQEYSGISTALERLAPIITDADTSRNLRWQQSVAGDATSIALWKTEATSLSGLQFYAYMQPGEAFMVVGHSMSTIYSTTTDIATLHGKVVLFTGDRKGMRECIPIILPP